MPCLLKQAVQDAGAIDRELSAHGFDQAALEVAAKLGYVNSCFEVDADDMADVVEEFYPMEMNQDHNNSNGQQHIQNGSQTIHDVRSIEQGLRQSVTAVS